MEIQSNDINTGIKIANVDNINQIELAEYILTYSNIVYLEINNIIYKNDKYIDNLNSINIKRQFNSFHQNDDIIKKYLYQFILENIPKFIDNLILFGGEMYGFCKLIKSNNLYAYSDFESIIDDTIYNSYSNIYNTKIINHINYDKYNYDLNINNPIIICNTSKSGLKNNLSTQINKINAELIFIISCNYKSFLNDYKILSKKYKIIKNLEINNVSVFLLNKN